MKIKFCKYHRNTFQTNLSPEYTYNPYRSPREPMALCIGKEGRKVFGASARKVKVSAAPIRIPREHLTAVPYTFRESPRFEGRKVQGARYLHSSMYTVSWLAAREEGKITDDRERERREEGGRKRQERRSVTVKQWLLPSVPLLPKHLVHVNQ